MAHIITQLELAARERANAKVLEVAAYVDALWRSSVDLTQAEVNVLQETRDLLLSEFSRDSFKRKTSTYFEVEEY